MPRKPLAVSIMLAVAFVSVAACSSGGSPSSTPSSGDKSSTSTNGAPTKLKKETGKGAIKNVFAKTTSGSKISLAAAAPGHEVMEQIYDADAKTWSAPTSVFKDDTRFCHSIKLKAVGDIIAATVSCSISAQDTNGTQSSYVLASTDGKTWKHLDLVDAAGKPSISPGGKWVAWSSPSGYLLWSPTSSFTTIKDTQSADAPTVGVMQDDGTLLIVKATAEKHGNCVIAFQSATAKAPALKSVGTTLPQPDHPKCVVTSAKLQTTDVIANFNQTVTTKIDGKKKTKTTTFAYAFKKLANGRWIIKV